MHKPFSKWEKCNTTNLNPFSSKPTQNYISKVYATLGSAILITFLSGYVASLGFYSYVLAMGLLFGSLIAELVIWFKSYKDDTTTSYLKPGALYALAIAFGQIIGGSLINLSGAERKL
jgi:FtsH-binding integral membrane protein